MILKTCSGNRIGKRDFWCRDISLEDALKYSFTGVS